MTTSDTKPSLNFIQEIVAEDLKTGKWEGRVHTRFPPEPNGYLHIGHAKSICLNFGIAQENEGGLCNLRFDDTNPIKEEDEYVRSIIEDLRWLGFDWADRLFFASDYFEQMYAYAVQLVKAGKAYVCDLTPEQTREHRGTLTRPGKNSPFRERSVEENLDLFTRMRAAEFADGSRTLRAKIDMASPNLNMRDPVIYRILRAHHHRTGDKWCIYPMYDWAHGLEDSIEGITHSICTLEFENHRPLYDWFLDQLGAYHPQQIEFARLELSYTIMSKRKLLELVQGEHVRSWDDPRMPTLSGMRRRGYTPESIRNFCRGIGVSKFNSVIDIARLEHGVREELNKSAPRVMAVLRPLRVVIDNYPEDLVEELEAVNNPEDPSAGTRKVPFSRVLYLERDDFREDPPRKFFRLAPGREVRLRYAYFITCVDVVKDETTGEIIELHCTYDPETRGGNAPDGRKVKATLHWVSAAHSLKAEVRLYDHLFAKENPGEVEEGADYKSNLNPNSLETLTSCQVEPSLAGALPSSRCQFERLGYFCVDSDSSEQHLVFNRTVTLRDTWAKIEKKQKPKGSSGRQPPMGERSRNGSHGEDCEKDSATKSPQESHTGGRKRRVSKTDDQVRADIRSELRRIIRKWNFLSRPLGMFRELDDRPEGRPRYQLCMDLNPRDVVGEGFQAGLGRLKQPEERIEDAVYDFARAVWHLKDRLIRLAKSHEISKRTVEDHGAMSRDLLIAADLITDKKHGGSDNRSGLHPRLDLVEFDLSDSGAVEYMYDGSLKESTLLVTNPKPVPFRVGIQSGDPAADQHAGTIAADTTSLPDASQVIFNGFRHWLPLIKKLGVFEGDDPETSALAQCVAPLLPQSAD